ncbi:MAG TPA: hypothetical protein EYN06_02405, partial [Myxococcales bacterium]|nr:hypothetical protein [Myxococcales bacterium]
DKAADCDPTADCNAQDSSVHKSAPEKCNGIDDNCNGEIDEGKDEEGNPVISTCIDYKNCGETYKACECPEKPLEDCTNGQDDDCDTKVDIKDPDCNDKWTKDYDGDGYLGEDECGPNGPYDARIHVDSSYAGCCSAEEVAGLSEQQIIDKCDFDCDGNPALCAEEDADGDGYIGAEDCNPNDPHIHANAVEKCEDGVDQDCEFGDVECGKDSDNDGFSAFADNGAPVDCDDSDPNINPWAVEVCNGKDDDCNGIIDDGNPGGGDTCINPNKPFGVCADAINQGVTVCGQQLNKAPAKIKDWAAGENSAVVCVDWVEPPEQELACDGLDDDCDNSFDEDFFINSIHGGDDAYFGQACGSGDCAGGTVVCTQDAAGISASLVTGAVVCTSWANVSAEMANSCDTKDNNCDGVIDGHTLYGSQTGCLQQGECAKNLNNQKVIGECLYDADQKLSSWNCTYDFATYEPGTEATCDGKDNNCDGKVDEAFKWSNLPIGAGCDGIGACGNGQVVCSTSAVGATCSTNPDAPGVTVPSESCDLAPLGVDEDCDGFINEGFNYGLKKWGQGCDGIGQCGSGLVVCNSQGQATCSTNPDGNTPKNTPEICNGVDDDCDGQTDEGLNSFSNDPKLNCKFVGQCNKQNVQATCVNGNWNCNYSNVPNYEGNIETSCDGKDNDCDGATDDPASLVIPSNVTCSQKGVCQGIIPSCHGVTQWVCDYQNYSSEWVQDEGTNHCDSYDNDCDGTVNEPNQNTIKNGCTEGFGTCLQSGVFQCKSNGQGIECSVSGKASGALCNDGNACTKVDKCSGGNSSSCAGTLYSCPDSGDGLACTTGECKGNGQCGYNIIPTFCVIGGVCYIAGAEDTAGCKYCNPTSDLTNDKWSFRDPGDLCIDGNNCTNPDTCDGNGVCSGPGFSCDDGLECTLDSCKGNGTSCDNSLIPGWCKINVNGNDACFKNGVSNPAEFCQICSSGKKTNGWSNKGKGVNCDDGNLCTQTDKCGGGNCNGTNFNLCNDGNECKTDSCNPATGCVNSSVSDGTGCDSDGISCTIDQCKSGQCEHEVHPSYCYIDDTCIKGSTLNSTEECLICDPSATGDQYKWTPRVAGTTCDDGNACTSTLDETCLNGICQSGSPISCDDLNICTKNECNPATGCENPNEVDGYPCESNGAFCTENVCNNGECAYPVVADHCYIDGSCYTNQTLNTLNACQVCDSTSNPGKKLWTNLNGIEFDCDADFDGCTVSDSCVNGLCTAGADADCSGAGDDCNTALCESIGSDSYSCSSNAKQNGVSCTSDGVTCTDDLCENGVCENKLQVDACYVANICYANGEEVGCQECNASSPNSLQDRNEGDICDLPPNSASCLVGKCDATLNCVQEVVIGSCFVAGVCYSDGELDPNDPCKGCQSGLSQTAFTFKGTGADCGTCSACTAGGNCVDDLTQDNDCSTCQKCGAGGSCVNQVNEDIKAECLVCEYCNAGSCASQSQTDFKLECPKCQYCNGGSCLAQSDSEDVKNECTADVGCGSGFCNGISDCSFEPNETGCDDSKNCTHTDECDGQGVCSGTTYSCTGAQTCNGAGPPGGCD